MDFLNKIDRQKLQKITLIVIAALTLLALVLLLVIIIGSVEGGKKPDDTGGKDVDKIADDIKFTDTTLEEDILLKGSLVLANKDVTYTMPSSVNTVSIYEYRNSHSTGIPYSIGDIYKLKLCAGAVDAAHAMLVDLGKETGNDSIMLSSAFGKQDNFSDIHTGYTMVLTVAGGASAYLSDVSNSVLSDWLNDNAYKYGFVVRYPANKADITGVSDYTHAFRYVGIPHAQYMKENDLCLEEYIDYLKNNTTYKNSLTIKAYDGSAYSVYYASYTDPSSKIKVPVQTPNPDGSINYSYTVSGVTEGGVVVTVKIK